MGSAYLRDLGSVAEFTGHVVVTTADTTGAINGAAVDTNWCRGIYVVWDYDTNGGTSTFDLKLQESADGSTGWADVSSAAIAQQAAVAVGEADWSGLNQYRYVRLVATAGGTSIDAWAVLALFDNQVSPNPK